MKSRSPSTREARADQIKGNRSPWAIGSKTHGLPTALSQYKKNQEDRARICFFKGFKQMLILLRQKMRCVWPAFLGRDGGRAQPDTPSHMPSITGLWVPIHKLPGRPQQTGRGQHSSGVPHSPQAPSQGSRERSSPLWAQPCGGFSCSQSHLSRQTSPLIYPAARSSHFPRKALQLLPQSLLSREHRPRPGDVVPTPTQNQCWASGWLRRPGAQSGLHANTSILEGNTERTGVQEWAFLI